jgi:hypothetical protein
VLKNGRVGRARCPGWEPRVDVGRFGEHAPGERGVLRAAEERVQRGRVHRALGEPQLVPVEPELLVLAPA